MDRFIEAVEKHAMTTQNKTEILCSYSDCKNHLARKDVPVIISHLIVWGFVKDYTVWIYHGEMLTLIQKKKIPMTVITWTHL